MKRLWQTLLLILPLSLNAFHYGSNDRESTGKIAEESSNVITPDAGPSVKGGINVFFTADFLYWSARMDGLAFATSGLGNNRSTVNKGHAHFPNWNWKPGFKVGIGHNLPHDGWDVFIEYTYIRNNAFRSVQGETLDPNWDVSDLTSFIPADRIPGVISYARGSWDLKFNVFDLELGRNYFVSQYLSVRPFSGFKFTWQDINYHVRYRTLLTDQIPESYLRMRNDVDFWGIGLRSGLDLTWHVDTIFSVYGNLALTALWAQYEILRRDTRTDFASPNPNPTPQLGTDLITYNAEKDFHSIKGVLELSIGLRGEWWFADERYHFLIQAGWEEQLWINHNQFIKLHFVESAHGDMVLQGFVLKARFDF